MPNCPKCGKPEIDVCPECGGPVEVYSRIVGYLRPIVTWNDGKQAEWEDRTNYTFWRDEQIKRVTDEPKHD
jgi:anaerobic ribonucleoside-triphosphate reductase